jgi:hypothetical protein
MPLRRYRRRWENNIEMELNLALQKVIQSIQMIPSVIKIGKEQLNILAYADNIVLFGKTKKKYDNFL